MGRLEQNWSCVLYLGFSISSSVPAQKNNISGSNHALKTVDKELSICFVVFHLTCENNFFCTLYTDYIPGYKKIIFLQEQSAP